MARSRGGFFLAALSRVRQTFPQKRALLVRVKLHCLFPAFARGHASRRALVARCRSSDRSGFVVPLGPASLCTGGRCIPTVAPVDDSILRPSAMHFLERQTRA